MRFSFSPVFVSFLDADKIPEKKELKEERGFFGSQLNDVSVVAGERYGRESMLVTATVSMATGV